VELEGRETSEGRIPGSLAEAYELRDASATSEESDLYQEHVYRLRREEYRSHGIRIQGSARRRERSRTEALRAGGDRRVTISTPISTETERKRLGEAGGTALRSLLRQTRAESARRRSLDG
jgi:hypothetical protein